MSAELEQFCTLAKTQRGAACAHLIVKAISHKNVFCFGEMLDLPSIQTLKTEPEFSAHYNTLELFAYGKFSNYTDDPSKYIQLTDVQITKLRQLTLATLAAKSEAKLLSYEFLMSELAMESVGSLQDLIVAAIYIDLVKGKLDQKNAVFKVSDYAARDVRPEDIQGMISKLSAWSSALTEFQQGLVEDATSIQKTLKSYRDQQATLNADITTVLSTLNEGRDGVAGTKRGNALKRSRNAGYGV